MTACLKQLVIVFRSTYETPILWPPDVKSWLIWKDPDAMILVFWMLSISAFSLSSFTFIKRLFSSSSLSAIRLLSSVYLTLLIFLLAVLILACASSSLAFHMLYSAYKLNKHDDNIQPWCTPFPIWNQSIVPCQCLTVVYPTDYCSYTLFYKFLIFQSLS